MSNRRLVTLIVLVITGLLSQFWARQTPAAITASESPVPDTGAPEGYVLVAKAVDGDTIELADGTKVRYLGIDTPETVHPSKPVQCFGREASEFNKSLVQGRYVKLVPDIEEKDKYGRLLRYVYLQDGTFVNLLLVKDGYAYAYTYPPNVEHAKEFVAAQAQARQASIGLWASCSVRK